MHSVEVEGKSISTTGLVLRLAVLTVSVVAALVSVFAGVLGIDLGSLFGGVPVGILIVGAAVLVVTAQIYFQQFFELQRSKALLIRQIVQDREEATLLRSVLEQAAKTQAGSGKAKVPSPPLAER